MVVNGLELVKTCETRKWNTQFHRKSFQRENRTNFSEVPFFPEIFQWNEPKKHVPFTTQPEFPESLGKWKTPIATRSDRNQLDVALRVRFFGKIRIRIFDPRSLGSWCNKGTDELILTQSGFVGSFDTP